MGYRYLKMTVIYFEVVRKTIYQIIVYEDFCGGSKIKQYNRPKRSYRVRLLIIPVTYSAPTL